MPNKKSKSNIPTYSAAMILGSIMAFTYFSVWQDYFSLKNAETTKEKIKISTKVKDNRAGIERILRGADTSKNGNLENKEIENMLDTLNCDMIHITNYEEADIKIQITKEGKCNYTAKLDYIDQKPIWQYEFTIPRELAWLYGTKADREMLNKLNMEKK